MADHPHACGENAGESAREYERYGPSPRVWGELSDERMIGTYTRTIPTRVGRTLQCQQVAGEVSRFFWESERWGFLT